MKTYFKYSVYSAALFSLSFLSACSDDIRDVTVPGGNDSEQGEGSENVEMKSIALNVSINNQTEADNNSIKNKWAVEDIIYVGTPSSSETEITIDNANSGFKKFAVSKIGEGNTTATFTGEVPADMSGKKLMVFYGNPSTLKVAGGKVKLDFTSQDQNSSDASILSSISDYSGEDSLDISLNNEGAIININMTEIVESGKTLKEVSLSLPEGSPLSFLNVKEYDTEGNITATPNNNITINMSIGEGAEENSKHNKVAVSVCPSSSEVSANISVSLKATIPSGDYFYANTMKTNIATGTSYSIELKSENEDKELKGNGTVESPYIIDNIEKLQALNLQKVRETTPLNYILSRNLDCTGIEGFTPIETFDGIFDGNGMTISNLTMTLSDGNGGLFAVNNGTIKNLNINKITVNQEGFITDKTGVGLISGTNNNNILSCNIINSSLKATIKADGTNDTGIGALVGLNKGNVFENKIESCTIESTNNSTGKCNIGGLVGRNTATGKIKFSSVYNSEVKHIPNLSKGGSNIGGFVGFAHGTIEGCSISKTTISDKQTQGNDKAITIGAFIGSAWAGNNINVTIKGCYSSGKVNSNMENNTHSGFIANCSGGGKQTIENCYTSATINKDGFAFIKTTSNNIKAVNCYFINGSQSSQIENVTAIKATELKGKSNDFNTALGWENYQFVAGTTDEEPLIIVKK